MKKSILALLTSLLTIAVYGQHKPSYIQDIGGTAILFFPSPPRVSTVDQGLSYEANYNGILYAASSYNVKQGALDFLYTNFEDSFYRGVLIGFAKSIHGKILYKKDIVVGGVKGIEYEGRGILDTTTYYVFYRSFYINKKLISQGIWFTQPVPRNDERLNSFFSTFKYTGKINHSSPWTDKTLIIKGIKYAFIIILIITLIIGSIIFVVKRPAKKSFKNE